VATAIKLVETVIASASYASRTAVHHTLGVSPDALVFSRNMLFPIPGIHNYNLIREHRQTLIDRNTATQNHRHYFKDYLVGNEVLIRVPNPAGLDSNGFGPFTSLAQVHVNGTVTIKWLHNLYERINIRHLIRHLCTGSSIHTSQQKGSPEEQDSNYPCSMEPHQ
jgi:hypothetical protein